METEKLTLDICFKYPKATIIFNRDNEKWFGIESFVYDYYSIDEPTFSINDCKLKLRPLSSLTDDELCLYQSLQVIHQNENGEVYYYDSNDSIDYLRSVSIDIDGLKEKGIAVYE